MPRYDKCTQEIIHCVVPQLGKGDLSASQYLKRLQWKTKLLAVEKAYDSFPEVFQEEGKRARCVGHCVRTMEDHKRVERVVIELYLRGNTDPIYTARDNLSCTSADTRLRSVPSFSMLLLSSKGFHWTEYVSRSNASGALAYLSPRVQRIVYAFRCRPAHCCEA